MPLFVDDEKLTERINHPRNIIKFLGPGPQPGSSNGSHRVLSPDMKAMIGTIAHLDKGTNVAKNFELSQSQVNDMKNGTMDNKQNIEVKAKIDENLKSARSLAIDKLIDVMNAIAQEKVKDLNPVQAAVTAEKLANVHEKLSGKSGPIANFGQVIYYAPRPKKEEDYPTIEAEVVNR